VILASVVLAPSAIASAPREGVLDPGATLGGLRLGDTKAQVRRAWGNRFGSCRGCREQTWYFNFRRFEPQGAGVSFRRGRVVSIFTLWAPAWWRTSAGLIMGAQATSVSTFHPGLVTRSCGTYFAYIFRSQGALTAIYVHGRQVWGFGLSRPTEPVCR
jgi:hypothetical protein